jgi:alanyl-tRNA synthetase
MTNKEFDAFDRLVELLVETAGFPKEVIEQALISRAKYVALPSSQSAISKAEAKRQRKAEKLQRQQGAA